MTDITSAAQAPLRDQLIRVASTVVGGILVGKGWATSDDVAQFVDQAQNLVGVLMATVPTLYLTAKRIYLKAKG